MEKNKNMSKIIKILVCIVVVSGLFVGGFFTSSFLNKKKLSSMLQKENMFKEMTFISGVVESVEGNVIRMQAAPNPLYLVDTKIPMAREIVVADNAEIVQSGYVCQAVLDAPSDTTDPAALAVAAQQKTNTYVPIKKLEKTDLNKIVKGTIISVESAQDIKYDTKFEAKKITVVKP